MHTELSVILTFPTGGDTGKRVSLTVTDGPSRVRLLTLELSATDFTQLMSSTDIQIEGQVPNHKALTRVGKKQQVHQEHIGREIDRDDRDAALSAAYAKPFPAPWNESSDLDVQVHYSRAGWTATYRCWLDEPTSPAAE